MKKSDFYKSIDLLNRIELFEHRKHVYNNALVIFEETGKILNEGLIMSYGADYICSTLRQRFLLTDKLEEYLTNSHYEGYIGTDSSILRFGKRDKEVSVIELIIPNNENYIERLTKFITACGWYKADETVSKQCRNGDVLIVFEKKYQEPLKNNGVSVPYKLYHITQECYVEKILKNGLIQKSGKKLSEHPERIYFFTKKFDDSTLSMIARQFFIHKNSNDYVDYNNMVLLTVDITKEKNSLKFYSDPNAEECVYTYDNIPPELIEKVEKISIN